MVKKMLLILLLVNCKEYIYAQSRLSEKITLSVSPGLAFPIGVFAKKDIANAVIYMPDRIHPAISSIEKSKSGFAKIGYSFQGELSFKISNHFYSFIRSGLTSNPISVSEIEMFFIDLYKGEQGFSQVDNELFTVTPGLGYTFQRGKWEYNAGVFLGYGKINYPYYELQFLQTLIWAHSGPRPELSSWVSGGLVKVNHEVGKFNTGLELLFQRANFDYNIFPRTIPGGSQSESFDDTIKTRILTVGLVVGYSF
jgi:hypothetical protein